VKAMAALLHFSVAVMICGVAVLVAVAIAIMT
jgi:hypothetical protein